MGRTYHPVRLLLSRGGESPMIRKTSKGCKVVSESGKNLSKDDLTKKQADKRLAQVEMFKHMKGKKK